MELVDQVVEGVLLARLSLPDAAQLVSPDVDVEALRVEVVEIRDRRDGIASLLAEGLISTESAREQAQRLTQRISEYERQIDNALGSSPSAELVGAADVRAAWSALGLQKKRTIIRSLLSLTILPAGKGVRFTPESVRVEWVIS